MVDTPNSLFGGRKDDYREGIEEITHGNAVVERDGEREETAENSDFLITENNEERTTTGDEVAEGRSERDCSKSLREADGPPVDDCCAICFGSFTIPCKTNCGHWFCANCILQFWNHRAALQRCKCPICSCLISKLTPEASSLFQQQEQEVIEVLKNIQKYNRLFVGGVHGLILKVVGLPLFIRRMFRGLMDPDRFRFNYCTMRVFALVLSCLYNISPFDFIPTGRLGIERLFDFCAVTLVFILFLVGIGHRWVLSRRARLLAVVQT
ncbi:unnamed protein product [Ilex paraguariensis]|uniref:RING-type domain-containing protein n=1 Tax=Ilex paraguariensis TaxID=185542 RepID=A0ABC8TH21_9AQUA